MTSLRFLLTLFFHIFFSSAFAQKHTKLVIVKTIDKGDYFYIPQSALEDSVNGIIYQDKILSKPNVAKKTFRFSWNSICNDGSYYLSITPEQVYFSSGHDNPNPNYLFWVQSITTIQYQTLKNALERKTPKGFSKNATYWPVYFFDKEFKDSFSIPEVWTDSILKVEESYCGNQIKIQLAKFYSIINSYLPSEKRIDFEHIKKIKPKYFSEQKREIIDWIPVETDANL